MTCDSCFYWDCRPVVLVSKCALIFLILLLIIPLYSTLQSINLLAKVSEPSHWECIHNSFQFHSFLGGTNSRQQSLVSLLPQDHIPRTVHSCWCLLSNLISTLTMVIYTNASSDRGKIWWFPVSTWTKDYFLTFFFWFKRMEHRWSLSYYSL